MLPSTSALNLLLKVFQSVELMNPLVVLLACVMPMVPVEVIGPPVSGADVAMLVMVPLLVVFRVPEVMERPEPRTRVSRTPERSAPMMRLGVPVKVRILAVPFTSSVFVGLVSPIPTFPLKLTVSLASLSVALLELACPLFRM